ncbi:unnamed protein product [Adineta steineri]|uniref:F-box domain-containing protein n=1 Tax=Adineta steineri TaxID=433720 RepID=A0A815J5U4_9BILA|nr:unnamed protein product [Adineta steineri]
MKLELLANEILLNVFEFLQGVDLLRTFHRLNARFDNLLFIHFRSNYLNFKSVSKTDFDIVCQQHLPLILDRIIALRLSENDETPQQTRCFFAYNITLGQFTHLQSLSLYYIRDNKIMDIMMKTLCQMTSLIHLDIYICPFHFSYINNIWSLPRLVRFGILTILHQISWTDVPTIKSLSLQHLSIQGDPDYDFSLERILKYTPHLRSFRTHLDRDYHSHNQLSYDALSIESLHLSSDYSHNTLQQLLKHVPNLTKLIVQTDGKYLDGHVWEKIMTDYLPKLKIFRLNMTFDNRAQIDAEQLVDEILDTFRTNFWINEHKWFVQCCWKLWRNETLFYLYTLPHTFSMSTLDDKWQFKSTNPQDISYVHPQSTCVLSFRCSDIRQLHVSLPLQDKLWPIISSFDRLSSISVQSSNDIFYMSQLQALIGKAPRLYSLAFSGKSSPDIAKLTSKSIRRLDLSDIETYFNKPACISLCHSSLGIQCEVLFIQTNDRQNIPYLVKKMKNLRALCVKCNDKATRCNLSSWLRQRLPPNCSISDEANFAPSVRVQLWIR